MNYVFFGSPRFAAIILEELVKQGLIPKALICNPDKPVGREKIITPPETKLFILNHPEYSVEILQPEKLTPEFASQLCQLNPTVFIVASYSKIIPAEILEIPTIGAIGIHPSMLPQYRGASPIQTAILNGDKVTGVSLYIIDEKVDHGPIIIQKEIEIGNKNYIELEKELAIAGAELFIQNIIEFTNKDLVPKEQEHEKATVCSKFKTEDAFINEKDLHSAQADDKELAQKILQKINALCEEPGAWTISQNPTSTLKLSEPKRIKLFKAHLTQEGLLRLDQIQIEGKKIVNL